jgi:poly(3-hydroxybutyrate) depolymerase
LELSTHPFIHSQVNTMRFLTAVTSFLSVAAAATLGKRAVTPGTLSQVTSFGAAPTKAGFYIYVPKKLAASPGVIVAIHYCTGSAQAYYNGSPYKTLSEQYGFIVIYPSSPHDGTCWDVSSKATLSHEGGGDSNTIANMVKWTLSEYKADASKVFVTGSSSGAMMTVRTVKSRNGFFANITAERHGSDLPRTLQGRHRLLRCKRRLLRLRIRRRGCVEQHLCPG